jgi:hypothetical protein
VSATFQIFANVDHWFDSSIYFTSIVERERKLRWCLASARTARLAE